MLNGTRVGLTRFGGCQPATIGAGLQNCSMTVNGLPTVIQQWLNDAVAGTNQTRNVILWALDSQGVGHEYLMNGAFPVDVELGVDHSSKSPGTVDIDVAANSFQQGPATSPNSSITTDGRWPSNSFSVSITGVDTSGIAEVSHIGFTLARNGTTSYTPGALTLNTITIEVGSPPSTVSDFDTWAATVAAGQIDRRDGSLNLLNSSLQQIVETIQFRGLQPTTLLDPFSIGRRRSIRLAETQIGF